MVRQWGEGNQASQMRGVAIAPALLVGFSLPGANEHAPNEWFPQENIEKGIRALAYLYEELRQGEEPARRMGPGLHSDSVD